MITEGMLFILLFVFPLLLHPFPPFLTSLSFYSFPPPIPLPPHLLFHYPPLWPFPMCPFLFHFASRFIKCFPPPLVIIIYQILWNAGQSESVKNSSLTKGHFDHVKIFYYVHRLESGKCNFSFEPQRFSTKLTLILFSFNW